MSHYIVGIGFSAGGIDPLNTFFDNTISDGISYVIIQHLPPDFKSLLAETLTKHSKLKIYEIKNNMPVEPDCVYLMPERKSITIQNGRLLVSHAQNIIEPNSAIDIFLDSLAADVKSKSIAILLSGTGIDGTKGASAVKKAGGMVIVQDPETALYNGMPHSLIESGNFDTILSPDKMPEAIINHVTQGVLLKKLSEDTDQQDEASLIQILEIIKKHTPLDFTNYKRQTILRRIIRRMVENNTSSLNEYIDYLLKDANEVEILSKEFLINVTRFFRDSMAFEILEKKVIPDILQNKLSFDQLKVWVVGCATGEEAYSLAILIKELLTKYKKDIDVKIFASDIDKDAIAFCSKAKYPVSIDKDVSEERLRIFFDKEGDFYKVKEEIRRMVIIANHDIIKQPPYTKVDLISCRNLLIYFNPILQKKVLSTLHYSLNLKGYLFLGPSESIGQIGSYFYEEDKKWKIYKNIEQTRTIGNLTYSSAIDQNSKFIKKGSYSNPVQSHREGSLSSEIINSLVQDIGYDAGVFIDDLLNIIIQPWGNYEKYFLAKFNFNLIEILPEQLAIAVGATLRKALEENKNISVKGIILKEKDSLRSVNILVKPILTDSSKKKAIILFNETGSEKTIEVENENFNIDAYTKQYIANLEKNSARIKLELDSANEIIQSYSDNTQAYNEELITTNEELQSTNEELQSINEELQTVNTQHQTKIKELADLNNDLTNYFKSTASGQIYVDRNLIIRRFTPTTTKQINLIEDDLGRSLTNISTNVRFDTIIDDITKAISDSIVSEKEIQVTNGNWYQMIIKPYVRQQDNKNDGAIITFNDITVLKKAQEKLLANAEVLVQKNAELLKINTDLDGFIYTASHDLRSPISNMEGLLSAIAENEDCYKNGEIRPLFDMMGKSIERLKKTIKELTEISKIQQTTQTDIQDISLLKLIEEIKFSLSELIVTSKAKIEIDIDSCPVIKFSIKNLRSIIYNLLSNSLKYVSAERNPEIVIKTELLAGYSVLIVKDNGLGIRKENQDKVFDMFKRFNDQVEGTGIGLYMVKRIIENAKGKIEVESEFGKGTTLKVYFKK